MRFSSEPHLQLNSDIQRLESLFTDIGVRGSGIEGLDVLGEFHFMSALKRQISTFAQSHDLVDERDKRGEKHTISFH